MKRRYFAAPTSVLSVLLLVLHVYPVGLFSEGPRRPRRACPSLQSQWGLPPTTAPSWARTSTCSKSATSSDTSSRARPAPSPVNPRQATGVECHHRAGSPYTTRIAVDRPIDPRKFNGTVVVEWLNVSGGLDDAPDWTLTHNELIREGFAWVGVSAQRVGVQAAATTDPSEYSSLSIPSDSFSYDIYSQAAETVRDDSAQILGG